jgi:intracellular multiplication protein IcmV
MGAKSIIKKGLVAGWNVKAWMGTDQIVRNGKTIKNLFVQAVAKPAAEKEMKKETFEECIQRLQITEEGLQQKIKKSGQAALLYLLLSIPMVAYTIYIFSTGFTLSGFVCLMLSFLLLVRAFREDFNRFQMKQRKLGCTVQEWLRGKIK